MSTASTASPFRISVEEEELARNEAFRSIRQRLERSEQENGALRFCQFHQHWCCDQEQSTFRLHRDILHALLLPLSQFHRQASQIASRTLPSRKAVEPELAFRGEARSAFSWLHCILTEEQDWCSTEGCPACVVLHVLHSEPTIRIVAVACLLSDHLQDTDLVEVSHRLPTFDFWMGALETAVREDPFWGDAFWPDIEYRACGLEVGIKQLVLQCLELRGVEEADEKHQGSRALCTTTTGAVITRYPYRSYHGALQISSLTRRQLRMSWEEQQWLSKMIVACWRALCCRVKVKKLEFPGRARPITPAPRTRSITS
ncbi:hypothetical protein VTN00DRAFT_8133 [Thermoascus crustaceus]|uniref:uncharacterized protein n=1 Tax=Thermoascus crustaceus TaxID=5088 RepID=UPI00374276CC